MNVQAAHIEDVYELSPLQQGMLFHTLRETGTSMYFHQVTYTLQGALDMAAFRKAWQKLAERHPALRISYHWENLEKPVQVVHRKTPAPIEELDWRGVAPTEQEERLNDWLKQDRQRGFVMSEPPLLRLTFIRVADDTHHFVWSQHHILWDGWSGPLVLKDLMALYEASREGRELRLPSQRPFRDYIAWLRQQDIGKAEAFWRRALSGFTTPTPLAVDRLAGERNGQPARAAEQRLHLPADFMAKLQAFARDRQLTLNTIMQGAWGLLLGRYSGTDDVVFGASVSGRPVGLAGVETMVGLFINTLPVRVMLPSQETVAEWLKTLQVQQAELRQYEYSPLVQVQAWSEVPRGLPLFESMVVFVNYAADRVAHDRFGHLKVLQVRQAVQQTDCPLGLVVVPGEELWLRLVHDTNRIEADSAARILQHFAKLLREIIEHPDQRVEDVSLLEPAERRRVIGEWNETKTAFPADRCIHELIAAQAVQRPDAIALTFQGKGISYGELDLRSNQLAHYLKHTGVRLEDRVVLTVDRSPELVVGILGVLKVGGTYVPIDPVLPAERQSFMLADSGAKVILTQEHLRAGLPPSDATVICLDADWTIIERQPSTPPANGSGPENLAYIIYTSGSTGKPKGVLVEHRGLTNIIVAQVKTYGIQPDSRVFQNISISFDVAQAEIFRALVGGATLCLNPADDLLPGRPMFNVLRNQRITFAGILPAPLSTLPLGEELPDLKALLVGGEQCPVELAAHWGRGRNIFNGYGPTEATICTTIGSNWDLDRPPPVGRPVANTRVYLLDKRMQPLPVGVPGELYIGGVGVSRGYLHQPELTAGRFLPDPFTNEPGGRMYRTGDLMRWRPDGNLEFLGRTDDQIKLRGFRIELGEIETVLGQHPEVLHGVVMVREDTPGNKRLVAYVVAQREPGPSAAELRGYLREKLPEYMVPSAFVFMRELPRTTNDKVDRRVLPAPAPDQSDVHDDYVGPRTPTEELICGVWADLLKLNRIGVYDNFFEQGGHSLLATQAVSRLRSAFQVDVPIRTFFECATVSRLAEAIDTARRQRAFAQNMPPLVARPRDRELPPSFAQQRLWFFEQLQPGNLFYTLPTAIRLLGDLNVTALQNALTEIVRRHEVLRTTFANRDGQPVQLFAPASRVELPVTDLCDMLTGEREDVARALAVQEGTTPLDVERGPLLRVRLLKLGLEEHVLLLTLHHIASDGWSMAIFFRELGTLYDAFAAAQPSPLSDLPVQYADFAAWQRDWLQGQVLDNQLAYWKKQLDGVEPLALLTDRPRPAEEKFTGAHETVQLSPDLNAKVKALSQREGVTPFMTLLAAFQVLLSRYTGQEDVSVGTPIAGRNLPETEGLIGFFVNTLVMRGDLGGNPTFRALLKRTRDVCLGAYDHQDVPFEKLVEELHPQRDLGHNPFFQVMFVLQNAPRVTRQLHGLTLSRLAADFEPPAKFDLTLGMSENENGGLRTTLKYNAELFDAATMQRMLGHFETLLEGIITHPEHPLSKLLLLPEREREQLLVDWNATDADYPAHRCVHQLFEERARERPDAIALNFYETRWTYQELNQRANRLAWHLRELGIGPERTAAIVMERSPEMIMAVLAVLKAGGAYVPLDPGQPQERLAFMLKDAEAKVVLTQQSLRTTLPTFDASIIEVDRLGSIVETEDKNPESGVHPDNLVYIIFTSGSTGQPKGVLVQHRGLTNVVYEQNRCFGTDTDSRVLQFLSLHFDAAQGEIFRTLTAGATLYLAKSDDLIPGPEMVRLYREWGITSAMLPTSVMAALPEDESMPTVQHMSVGGEACPAIKAARWRKDRLFFNGYGPTETTICATHANEWNSERTPPIGRPIANMKAYVLDRLMRPVPVGVSGELYVGGIGVTRGYLHRPDLTAGNFLPDPFATRPGTRMYRTGDLVRWLPDGQLDFLGRTDEQVKIRGFRIELGEIENVLLRHAEVRDCAVVVLEDHRGEKQLIGYVSLVNVAPPAAEIKEHLRKSLPEYMVPAAFVFIESIPRKLNGKVDRKQLPRPSLGDDAEPGEYVAPRNPAEELVASTWADVLGRDRIGIHDSFFDIGGHSLLATQVVSRLRSTFGVEVPLRTMFESPTVAGLAEQIETSRRASHGLQSPPMRPVHGSQDLPLSFAQQRLWFLDQLNPGNAHYSIPVSIRLTGTLNRSALQKALSEILRRHDVLRTIFPAQNGTPVQHVLPSTPLTLPITNLTHLAADDREAQAREMAAAEARQPFDLANGPLVRARLLQLNDNDHVLLLSLHHIVTDGWSMTIFFRELGTLYEAFTSDQPSPLPELTIQYGDFAVWQRDWLQGDPLECQLGYWKEKLADVPALELPTDYSRPAVHRYRGANHAVRLPRELSDKLNELSRQEGATLFMTLLAAFQALLSRYSRQDDLSVGTPIAGRNRQETEDLIGFFVNTLVMRTDLTGDPTFKTLLGRVRETCLGAYAHQDVPFEKLVDELQPSRDLARNPLFQVFFVLQNAPKTSRQLTGLTISRLDAELAVAAKFDLTLGVTEMPDGLGAVLKYNADLFDESMIRRMMQHWQTLLEEIVAAPGRRLSELTVTTEAERRQVLLEWNKTDGMSYDQWGGHSCSPETQPDKNVQLTGPDRCIHELFEAQVDLRPDAVALSFESQTITYSELDRKANQLARHLCELGVIRGNLVGICIERSPEMIIGMLGTLKAGAAYVPLDPALPTERLTLMLEDTKASVILTQQRLESVVFHGGAKIICLDRDWPTINRQSDGRIDRSATPEDIAYVIYTSGSTGRPKGVLAEHRNVTSAVYAQITRYGLKPDFRVLQVISYGFDAGNGEIFRGLLSGATLVMPSQAEYEPGRPLADLLRRQRINAATFSPAMLATLPLDEELPELRVVMTGGETFSAKLAEHWSRGRRFFNGYGPTEATICSTAGTDFDGSKPPSIGRPLANSRIYVLDAALRPTGVGVPGEVYIGGAGVARGYLEQPDQTAERFLPDCFADSPGARMYRTGDLARWSADGQLYFMGRCDSQVKLRGYRIELGEIEAVLTQYSNVCQAAAVVREDKPGDKQLVAYVVPAQEPPPSVAELSAHLKAKLPEYMVPAAFVTLPDMPRTINGKVDRAKLPPPDTTRPELAHEYVAPMPGLEATLADIWISVLKLERVGVHDNFFALGGDSLLSIQVIARANQSGLHLTAKDLFQHQTIAELAAAAEQAGNVAADQGPVTGTIPLTPLQHAFFEQSTPEPHHDNRALLLEVRQPLDSDLLDRAFRHVQEHHDALRLRFRQNETTWEQWNTGPETIASLIRVDLSAVSDGDFVAAVETEAARIQTRLHLSDGPLVQLAYFTRDAGQSGRILLVAHRLIADALSLQLAIEDLVLAYQQLRRGQLVRLPPKTASFKQWAEHLQTLTGSDVVAAEQDYWADVTRTDAPAIPLDHPDGTNTRESAETITVELDPDDTRAIVDEVSLAYRMQTLEVLLTALVQAVETHWGQRSIRVEIDASARDTADASINSGRTVGNLDVRYPVVLDLQGVNGPGETLVAVKEQMRAVPDAGLGYGLLRYLNDADMLKVPPALILFELAGAINDAGGARGPLAPALESPGPLRSRLGNRSHAIEISARIIRGRLRAEFTFSRNLHEAGTIKQLAQGFVDALQALVAHCRTGEAGNISAADFPAARVSETDLARLLSQIGGTHGGGAS